MTATTTSFMWCYAGMRNYTQFGRNSAGEWAANPDKDGYMNCPACQRRVLLRPAIKGCPRSIIPNHYPSFALVKRNPINDDH